MDAVVKKSLGAPLRQMTSCFTGNQDGFSRKGKSVRRKSAPCCYGQTAHDSSWLRTYQAELHRERYKNKRIQLLDTYIVRINPIALKFVLFILCLNRKLRQVKVAQKNAERAAMRIHHRSPHRFTKVRVFCLPPL